MTHHHLDPGMLLYACGYRVQQDSGRFQDHLFEMAGKVRQDGVVGAHLQRHTDGFAHRAVPASMPTVSMPV
jgi:hypothetical protein